MGNAALLLRALGHEVLGADTGIYPPMSTHLQNAGIQILEGWNAERLAKLNPDLVIVGNVASRGHPEVEHLLQSNQNYISLPQLLRSHLLCDRKNIVIAGTHGKTTTTCLAAYLLKESNHNPGWLVGGVPRDLPDSSFVGQKNGPFVIEGDEYDSAFFDKRSKFIQYLPHILAINNIEFDHADIFRDLEDVLKTFSHGLRVVPGNGIIVVNGDDLNVLNLVKQVTWAPVIKVGVGKSSDVQIKDFTESASGSTFSLVWKGNLWAKVEWSLTGMFNARNAAIAATSAGLFLNAQNPTGLNLEALKKFKGVMRRQEILIETKNLICIEDFGHHPTALQCTLESLRNRYPTFELVACFEPRSNTAVRKVMQEQFSKALALADSIYLPPAHRAEKLGSDSFDSAGIAKHLQQVGRQAQACVSHDDLLQRLIADCRTATHPRLVIFFSNGSFGGIIQKFTQAFK
jgi:UDP-N-acetylmuramate: L-alanyl-gamma-D-glutamyl-meso-diaminopimelate ligase